MGYQITRPDADQVKFTSSKTGDHLLDEYIQDAELGNLTLAQLLLLLFDSSGVLIPPAAATTPAPGTSTTLLATTEFVTLAIAAAPGTSLTAVNVFTKNQSVTPVALTAGATVSVDASLSNSFTLTPNQNFTLAAPTNPTNGMVVNFVFTQPATPRLITFATAYQFAGGTEPTLTAAASAIDFMSAYYNGATSKWICVMNKDFKA